MEIKGDGTNRAKKLGGEEEEAREQGSKEARRRKGRGGKGAKVRGGEGARR